MVWRALLAFLVTMGAGLGLAWMRGGFQPREAAEPSAKTGDSSSATRHITLAVSGMT
jgi:hypothetical protein